MPLLFENLDVQDEDNFGWHQVKDLPLYLPSSLEPDICSIVCTTQLISMKDKLRYVQAHEALHSLHRQLCACVMANKWKIKNVTGQVANTKAHVWQKSIDRRSITHKHAYNRARQALLALQPPGEWSEIVLHPLEDSDICRCNEHVIMAEEAREQHEARLAAGVAEEEILAVPINDLQLGEGCRTMSWI